MNLRLYNARILTMEPNREIFRGEIWVKNEKIVYVADQEEIEREWRGDNVPRISWDCEIDCEENLLMPGFKNAHTHSAMTFLRSASDDVPLQDWLQNIVFPAEKRLTDQDIYQLTRLAILEYLTSGITSIFDMYLKPDVTAKACLDMGMRCVLVSGLNDFTSSIDQVEEEYVRWNRKNPLISYQLGFHAEYTCDRALMVQLSGLAHRHRAPVFTHMSETMDEVRECKKKYGMTPAFFLDSLGMFDFGGGGYHCVHMTDNDMDVFRRHRMYVITNPASNAKLASGVAPIMDFVRNQIPVAIGTDGAGSNNALDMFREMFLVSGLSKLREMDASSVDAMEVLRMATVNGAKAMRLNRADVLAKGKLADMILLDLHQPNMQPIHNIPKNVVYSGSKANVKMTIVGGKILYKDGMFNVGDKPENIYNACNAIAQRLLSE
ncbi:MAG: amidohydrolase [Lachnospiraceae bacterium]|nr:amidohydrolase [Lachnospiraceae bacterium]